MSTKMNGFADAAPQSRPAATTEKLDKLVEIPQYSLIKLRNLFKANWPAHISGYYLIDNYMTWLERVNNIKNLKIYSLDGEWRKDGTFVIIVSVYPKKYSQFDDTRETHCHQFLICFLLHRIDIAYFYTRSMIR